MNHSDNMYLFVNDRYILIFPLQLYKKPTLLIYAALIIPAINGKKNTVENVKGHTKHFQNVIYFERDTSATIHPLSQVSHFIWSHSKESPTYITRCNMRNVPT